MIKYSWILSQFSALLWVQIISCFVLFNLAKHNGRVGFRRKKQTNETYYFKLCNKGKRRQKLIIKIQLLPALVVHPELTRRLSRSWKSTCYHSVACNHRELPPLPSGPTAPSVFVSPVTQNRSEFCPWIQCWRQTSSHRPACSCRRGVSSPLSALDAAAPSEISSGCTEASWELHRPWRPWKQSTITIGSVFHLNAVGCRVQL